MLLKFLDKTVCAKTFVMTTVQNAIAVCQVQSVCRTTCRKSDFITVYVQDDMHNIIPNAQLTGIHTSRLPEQH